MSQQKKIRGRKGPKAARIPNILLLSFVSDLVQKNATFSKPFYNTHDTFRFLIHPRLDPVSLKTSPPLTRVASRRRGGEKFGVLPSDRIPLSLSLSLCDTLTLRADGAAPLRADTCLISPLSLPSSFLRPSILCLSPLFSLSVSAASGLFDRILFSN